MRIAIYLALVISMALASQLCAQTTISGLVALYASDEPKGEMVEDKPVESKRPIIGYAPVVPVVPVVPAQPALIPYQYQGSALGVRPGPVRRAMFGRYRWYDIYTPSPYYHRGTTIPRVQYPLVP